MEGQKGLPVLGFLSRMPLLTLSLASASALRFIFGYLKHLAVSFQSKLRDWERSQVGGVGKDSYQIGSTESKWADVAHHSSEFFSGPTAAASTTIRPSMPGQLAPKFYSVQDATHHVKQHISPSTN